MERLFVAGKVRAQRDFDENCKKVASLPPSTVSGKHKWRYSCKKQHVLRAENGGFLATRSKKWHAFLLEQYLVNINEKEFQKGTCAANFIQLGDKGPRAALPRPWHGAHRAVPMRRGASCATRRVAPTPGRTRHGRSELIQYVFSKTHKNTGYKAKRQTVKSNMFCDHTRRSLLDVGLIN